MSKRIISLNLFTAFLVSLVFSLGFAQTPPSFPSSQEAGLSFETLSSSLPENYTCLNEAGEAGLAKELINLLESIVVVGGGENEMPDGEWESYEPQLPWQKNINRNTMFNDSCFYRSPNAPADCQGEACRVTREVSGYEWIDLSRIVAQDCLPTADAGCTATGIEPGAVDLKVTSKCHQIIFNNEIYELVDTEGNRYVMHATETGTPDVNAALPEGWTLSKVSLDEPLIVNPFGGGDNCYHNVLRDNLGQGYHQYVFAGGTYPMASSALNFHNGYWVAEAKVEGVPLPITVINDMHIDPATNRVTVYAQNRVRDQVLVPAQVGPGECTEALNGETACFHPDAVYLNGSGQELSEADGTGAWWVKHAWVLPDENGEGGEGYDNCELKLAESYDDCFWVEGVLLDDGVSIKVGATDVTSEGFYNIRTPLLDESPIRYSVTRFAPKNTDPEVGEVDLTPTAQWELIWDCREEVSAFDNQARSCSGSVSQ